MIYKHFLKPQRTIYPEDDLSFNNFSLTVKRFSEIFIENYYFTIKWSENQKIYSLNCLEKYFIMSSIIINHCFEGKFENNSHYFDFHARFTGFNELIEIFYNIISENMSRFLHVLIDQINLILSKESTLKSKFTYKIVQYMMELENDSIFNVIGYLLYNFNETLRNYLLMITVISILFSFIVIKMIIFTRLL